MNIYDFDDTIYDGDSGIDFVKYSFKKYPLKVLVSLIKAFFEYVKYIFDVSTFEKVKDKMFSFTKKIINSEDFIDDFWNKNEHKIKKWYIKNQKKDDIIISASLDIYLEEIIKRLNIKYLICTKTNTETKEIIGKNCKGEEKIKRLNEMFDNIQVNNAYSDSLSDEPMFRIAKKGYIIKKEKLELYDSTKKYKKSIFKMFLNKDFLLFVFCGGMGTLANFVFSCLFSTFINPVVSYIIGYSLSLFVAYYFNIKLLFKRKANIKDFIKFIISYIPNFIILVTFVYIFIDILLWNKILVYGIVALLAIPLTYLIVKLFAFKKDNNEKNNK